MRTLKLNKSNKMNYNARVSQIIDGYNIKSSLETVEKIVKDRCSIARFGDGELAFINKVGLYFQEYDDKIAKKLDMILHSNEEKLLIGVPLALNYTFIDNYIGYADEYWRNWIVKNKFKMLKMIKKQRPYYSAQISRFYLDYKDKESVPKYVEALKKIWDDRDVVIIEGEKSRLGAGNDLFDNMRSLQRILGPAENAFEKYDEIMAEVKKQPKDKLIILALGPTATLLAYDLYKEGYQAVDIGHVDIEYEWFLRKATTKIKIEGKYMGESGVMNQKEDEKSERLNVENVNDDRYEKQIIAKIL